MKINRRHLAEKINRRNLIIGCGKKYGMTDMDNITKKLDQSGIFPHNHSKDEYITIDIDANIEPHYLFDMRKVSISRLELITKKGKFNKIYFENLLLIDKRAVENVMSMLASTGCIYYVGTLEKTDETNDFNNILHAYQGLNCNVEFVDEATAKRVNEKLFPPDSIKYFNILDVIKISRKPSTIINIETKSLAQKHLIKIC
ncbi:hypothetical protein FE392_12315 [Xenorhabdus sp. 12]|uniref:Uncharacterized protein n=1 Tax=Xenorhabdus santafensis TaxID=2582833 RepID=A0ABU4SBF0_9GAMM|nr:hypothetical protein [Xenorhabdus sp. 12]MDX7988108.1 hypothetical protein [Xenorhabdus sp. 12]